MLYVYRNNNVQVLGAHATHDLLLSAPSVHKLGLSIDPFPLGLPGHLAERSTTNRTRTKSSSRPPPKMKSFIASVTLALLSIVGFAAADLAVDASGAQSTSAWSCARGQGEFSLTLGPFSTTARFCPLSISLTFDFFIGPYVLDQDSTAPLPGFTRKLAALVDRLTVEGE